MGKSFANAFGKIERGMFGAQLSLSHHYEADLIFFKHYFIGILANGSLNKCIGLPDDIFSRSGGTGIDCKFDSTLMADIARQSRIPMSLTSIDASQCYDSMIGAASASLARVPSA